MIRKSGDRFSLGTNAKRLPAGHAQSKSWDHDPIQSNRVMISGTDQNMQSVAVRGLVARILDRTALAAAQ
jgi:hypothetical protein